jgi:hypothetical protein
MCRFLAYVLPWTQWKPLPSTSHPSHSAEHWCMPASSWTSWLSGLFCGRSARFMNGERNTALASVLDAEDNGVSSPAAEGAADALVNGDVSNALYSE